MMTGKLSIISREIIKPSSPTPSDLHTYNLSELDHIFGHVYVPLILLYPKNAHNKAAVLKQSLSLSLTKYYPFAGRVPTPNKPSYIDCNDEGVLFVEAKIDSPLSVLQRVTKEDESMDQLFADKLVVRRSPQSTNVFAVQLNHFACGGVAVAVSISHAIGDACTLGCFVNYWAAVARYGSTDHQEVVRLNPHYIHSSRTNSLLPESQGDANSKTSRKFIFPNSKLSELKNKVIASAEDLPISNPTRLEVLISLLYKTAIGAATKNSGCFEPCCLLAPVEARNKFAEKLPQTTVGNLLSGMMVPTMYPSETSLSYLVSAIKKEKLQIEGVQSVQHAALNILSVFTKMGNQGIKRSFTCTSFCGFPFNKVDFGWGKPMGACLPLLKADVSCFLLMDTPDGNGIEAYVYMEKEEMEIFENDKEMLAFCQND